MILRFFCPAVTLRLDSGDNYIPYLARTGDGYNYDTDTFLDFMTRTGLGPLLTHAAVLPVAVLPVWESTLWGSPSYLLITDGAAPLSRSTVSLPPQQRIGFLVVSDNFVDLLNPMTVRTTTHHYLNFLPRTCAFMTTYRSVSGRPVQLRFLVLVFRASTRGELALLGRVRSAGQGEGGAGANGTHPVSLSYQAFTVVVLHVRAELRASFQARTRWRIELLRFEASLPLGESFRGTVATGMLSQYYVDRFVDTPGLPFDILENRAGFREDEARAFLTDLRPLIDALALPSGERLFCGNVH